MACLSGGLFALYTLISAAQQGLLCFLLREFVPPRYGQWINAAFHYMGGVLYLLVVGYAGTEAALRVKPASWLRNE